MIDSIILAPYYWTLRLRHLLYDKGVKKVHRSPVPAISIGNVTVGGTGKTPVTEMLIRRLKAHPSWSGRNIAVLSRGYGRKTKGFLEVNADGSAVQYGDEPLQIKRKFPDVTVSVDKDRVEGCNILSGCSEAGGTRMSGQDADLIILDDAFQYRRLKADVDIVLMDYGRPVYKDHLLPLGRLRDLPRRIRKADIVIVTKCPAYLDEWRQGMITENLGFNGDLFFTKTSYEPLAPVFAEGDQRYVHSQRLILFSGIANDTPMYRYLGDTYRIVRHLKFGDHHRFTASDIPYRRNSHHREGQPEDSRLPEHTGITERTDVQASHKGGLPLGRRGGEIHLRPRPASLRQMRISGKSICQSHCHSEPQLTVILSAAKNLEKKDGTYSSAATPLFLQEYRSAPGRRLRGWR